MHHFIILFALIVILTSTQDGNLGTPDDAVLRELSRASWLAVGLDDRAGVHERLVGATIHAHKAAKARLGAASLALHGDDCRKEEGKESHANQFFSFSLSFYIRR